MIQQVIEYLFLLIAFTIWTVAIYKIMNPSRIIFKEAEKRYKEYEPIVWKFEERTIERKKED